MSKRMNKERAREILKELKSETRKYMREVTRKNKEEVIKICKDICEEEREALDIAIDSLKYDDEQVKFLKNSLDYVDNKKDNEWTDIRDGLPKKSGWYWVTQKFDFKGEFEYQNETNYEVDKEWFDSTKNEFDFTHKYIIAWRTYEPKPYKRKEE